MGRHRERTIEQGTENDLESSFDLTMTLTSEVNVKLKTIMSFGDYDSLQRTFMRHDFDTAVDLEVTLSPKSRSHYEDTFL